MVYQQLPIVCQQPIVIPIRKCNDSDSTMTCNFWYQQWEHAESYHCPIVIPRRKCHDSGRVTGCEKTVHSKESWEYHPMNNYSFRSIRLAFESATASACCNVHLLHVLFVCMQTTTTSTDQLVFETASPQKNVSAQVEMALLSTLTSGNSQRVTSGDSQPSQKKHHNQPILRVLPQ